MGRYAAIKVGISGTSLPRREPGILQELSTSRPASRLANAAVEASDLIPNILDEFTVEGPNGSHPCYAVAPAQGNLREASFSRLFPVEVARALVAKLSMAVAFVHPRGYVHGGRFILLIMNSRETKPFIDIHLWNILVRLPSTFDELSIDQFRERYGEPETVPIRRVGGEPLPPNVPPKAVLLLHLGKKPRSSF